MYLVDLHCHTRCSYDNFLDPRTLLQSAKCLGLYGVGIVEHHSIEVSRPVQALAVEYGVHVFRGLEISTDEGHLLVFGLYTDRWNRWRRNLHIPLTELLPILQHSDAIAIPAHPFRRNGDGLGETVFRLNGWTAIETHNGLNDHREDARARAAARELGLPSVGGSDCHQEDQIGRCLTVFARPIEDIRELMAEIRAGRCYGICRHGEPS
jgi:predicted metal-dependent phosphoesterase TrpH